MGIQESDPNALKNKSNNMRKKMFFFKFQNYLTKQFFIEQFGSINWNKDYKSIFRILRHKFKLLLGIKVGKYIFRVPRI